MADKTKKLKKKLIKNNCGIVLKVKLMIMILNVYILPINHKIFVIVVKIF